MIAQALKHCLQGSQCFISAPKVENLLIVAILGYELKMKCVPGFCHVFVVHWFCSLDRDLFEAQWTSQ